MMHESYAHVSSVILKPPLRGLQRRGACTTSANAPRAFTLTELLIAVAILVIVILASARIFGTASKITGIGQATTDVMTEASVIERQIRSDLSKLSHEGIFAIRCVSVRNDVNGNALLNPELEPDALIRADQLVFFANGVESAQSSRQGRNRNNKGQSTSAFVYYGHAFQLPDARPYDADGVFDGDSFDAAPNVTVFPWSTGSIAMVRTKFDTVGSNGNGTDTFSRSNAGTHPIQQPGARQWLLARQTAILGDDDSTEDNRNSKTVYLGQTTAARSIFLNDPISGFSPQLRDGRVEAAATELPEVRTRILNAANTWDWEAQRQRILDQLVYYPRAERTAPSMHRVDQALTNAVIASGCSSFKIDWTYDLGVGEAFNAAGTGYIGISNSGTAIPSAAYEPAGEIRWFGYPDARRGVFPFGFTNWPDGWDGRSDGSDAGNPGTIWVDNIEQFVSGTSVEQYNYVFGFNQTRPFEHPMSGLPDESFGIPDIDAGFTPWPSALRITMTLHDPGAKLEGGREFQFIVRLPKRQ